VQACPFSLENCPFAWGILSPSNTCFIGPTRVHNPNGILISSAVFAQLTVECPYTLQWAVPSPSKLPLCMVGSGPSYNTWFLGTTRVLNPNGISISSAVFAGLTTVSDQLTDRPCYSVGNNRPHLRVLPPDFLAKIQDGGRHFVEFHWK